MHSIQRHTEITPCQQPAQRIEVEQFLHELGVVVDAVYYLDFKLPFIFQRKRDSIYLFNVDFRK